jgi:hypothetical protein
MELSGSPRIEWDPSPIPWALLQVTVTNVNTVNVLGKVKKDPLTGRPYKRSDVKKAYVTVTEPVTVRVLPLFDGSGCAKPCTSPVYAASKRRLQAFLFASQGMVSLCIVSLLYSSSISWQLCFICRIFDSCMAAAPGHHPPACRARASSLYFLSQFPELYKAEPPKPEQPAPPVPANS